MKSKLFLAAMLAVSSTSALAAEQPTVALVGVHQDAMDLEKQTAVTVQIAAAIESDGRFGALMDKDLRRSLAGREEIVLQEAFLAQGRQLLEDGRILYQQAQAEEAVGMLEQATESLALGMSTVDAAKDLWSAWTQLGTARKATGDEEGARAAWLNAISLNPVRGLDPTQYPPDMVSAYEKIRSSQASLVSTLHVTSNPGGAEVFLNGERVGKAPMDIPDVAPGVNHLVLRGDDGTRAYEYVQVPQAGELDVTADLEAANLGAAGASNFARSRQTDQLYRALGNHLEADVILVAGINGEVLMVQAYSPRTESYSKVVGVPFADTVDDEILTQLPQVLAMINDDGTIKEGQAAPLPSALDVGANPLLADVLLNPSDNSLFVVNGRPRWLVWGLVGAGAVGAAATAGVFIATSAATADQGTIVVGPVP